MEKVTGYVGHIVFRNAENGYTVFHLENDDGEVTCVGNFNYITEGELLEITGEYVTHSVYGNQLKVMSHVVKEPEDLVSIERYLGSGAVKGIGAALAGRIVRKFKEDTFRIIEEEPERLAEIKGISERKAREISSQLEDKKDLRKAMIYLQKYGISAKLAAKIYNHYGMRVYKVMEENPYELADNIEGIGFRTADEIAARIGIHTDSDYRIKSGLFYTLQQAVGEGHIYLPQEELLRRARTLLEVEIDDIEKHVMDLCIEKKVVMKECVNENKNENEIRIYPAHYYYMELNTAKMLHDLNINCDMPEEMMERRLCKVERAEEIKLDPKQHTAVIESIKHGLLVLTGGPGTGKTTTINTMIRFFESEGMSILLAAPTGRATKRMTEATGYEAQTIHRLLEVNVNPEEAENSGGFLRNRQNPLEADVIIIDEMSMVDLTLMHALLSAVIPGTRLILVGDVDQLPSVGPGSVLKDIIASHRFPVVTLTRIFRQAGESDIIVNAHKINAGEPVIPDNKSRDFFFLRRQDADTIIGIVIMLIQKKLPKYVGADQNEIQVMTPTRKGLLGVERLNEILQKYLNPEEPKKAQREINGRLFREGDKVMQIKNNYTRKWQSEDGSNSGHGIYNGDIGYIYYIDKEKKEIFVIFDSLKIVTYKYDELDELDHSFCTTIHKSQGSEFPIVVIPMAWAPPMLLSRNLLYTAVTRAKKQVVLVGEVKYLEFMIKNNRSNDRYSNLAVKLNKFKKEGLLIEDNE